MGVSETGSFKYRQFKQCALSGIKLFIHLISLNAISFLQMHLIVLLSKPRLVVVVVVVMMVLVVVEEEQVAV